MTSDFCPTLFPQIDLYAGALFVHICLGWNFYLSTILTLAITAVYTIAGTVPESPPGTRSQGYTQGNLPTAWGAPGSGQFTGVRRVFGNWLTA